MGDFDSTIKPPRAQEAVKALRDLLAEDAVLIQQVGGEEYIYAHRTPGDKPPVGEDNVNWRRLIVQEIYLPGGRRTAVNGLAYVQIQVVVEIGLEGILDPDKWAAAVHNRLFEYAVGKELELTFGACRFPVQRWSDPTPCLPDEDEDSLYSSAEYRIMLAPAVPGA